MSYETDNLKREIDTLKWQKAEDWKLNNISSLLTKITAEICELKNRNSYLGERIQTLEDRLNQT
jgi:hypothetical protein